MLDCAGLPAHVPPKPFISEAALTCWEFGLGPGSFGPRFEDVFLVRGVERGEFRPFFMGAGAGAGAGVAARSPCRDAAPVAARMEGYGR
ncbi:hypothetical protein ACFYMW_03250 [Streptomyces sp. NPDC006692]|uniref:hypothetical protein n=1 Tax=Streptomyces sp. NPDC006692 TaxID=3364758 RepID=UPI0036C713FF